MIPHMAEARPALKALEENAARLRTIYLWLTLGGTLASACTGLWLGLGGVATGPMVGVAVFAVGAAAMGAGLLLTRRRAHLRILRALVDEPASIVRVFPKLAESTLYGVTTAQHRWIVLELSDGSELEVYASTNFERVLAEVRRCAPKATLDARWVTERTNVR
jgi:hypothetical protein